MIYFANPTGKALQKMKEGVLGYIDTPKQGNARPAGITWCADNGCFGKGFDEQKWFTWLEKHSDQSDNCVFATAPDVVEDASATLVRSAPWLQPIRSLGYPVAFVAQDGIEETFVPWPDFDCLFIGGSTEFKLGQIASHYVQDAKSRGMWVHMGRVNSLKRLRYAEYIGCDSVDGTMLCFNPTARLAELLSWLEELDDSPVLFGMDTPVVS